MKSIDIYYNAPDGNDYHIEVALNEEVRIGLHPTLLMLFNLNKESMSKIKEFLTKYNLQDVIVDYKDSDTKANGYDENILSIDLKPSINNVLECEGSNLEPIILEFSIN